MEQFSSILQIQYQSNTVQDYISAIGIFFATFIILYLFKNTLLQKARKFAKHTKVKFDDVLVDAMDTIDGIFYTSVSLYVASLFLELPHYVERTLLYAIIVVATYYVALSIQKTSSFIIRAALEAKEKDFLNIRKGTASEEEKEPVDPQIVSFLTIMANILVWIVAGLLILQNIGYNISALLGGLGVIGIAVGFALQNVLSDLFAYLTIHLDRPFKLGDFIIIGGDMGTIEKIGLKSTRIRTLEGQQLVITNRELTESRVNNYHRMWKRRIVFTFGVTYDTANEKLNKIPDIVKKIIKDIELTTIDRVHFNAFADSALNYEVVYYIDSRDYNVYMDIQQDINLKLKYEFEKEKIEFAFPSHTVYMHKMS